MQNAFKRFLVSTLLLSAIGAVAQTATNGQAVSAQENGTATATTVVAARLNEPAELFMSHLRGDGLLDHVFMKVTANLAPTRTASTAISLCRPSCTDGLVCCLCVGPPTCETQAKCNFQCHE